MSTTHELLARASSVYSKYEKYVVKRPGDGEDADGRRADGAYGAAYAALLDRVNGLMQVREGKKMRGEKNARRALSRRRLPHTPFPSPASNRKRMRCGRRRTGRPRPP
jgi:hypothetical protein